MSTRQALTQKAIADYQLLLAEISETTMEIGQSRLMTVLEWMAKFPQRSARNTILIQIQRPGATLCRGRAQWYDRGRLISKGERGLAIWAPHTSIVENNAGEKVQKLGFHIAYVWDITQTTIIDEEKAAADEEQMQNPLAVTADAGHLENDLISVAHQYGLRVETAPLYPASGRLLPSMNLIEVGQHLNLSAERAAVLAHEIAHHLLAHAASKRKDVQDLRAQEWEAECVAWIVMYRNGIDTRDMTSAYLRSYQLNEGSLSPHLTAIMKASERLLESLEEVRNRVPEAIAAD